jgi:hypothetical protein
VRAEPPAAHPGESVALDALVAGVAGEIPGGVDASALEWLWLLCAPEVLECTDTAVGLGSPPRCADAPGAPVCVAGTDPVARYQVAQTALPGQIGMTVVSASRGSGGTAACLDRMARGEAPGAECAFSRRPFAIAVPGIPVPANPTMQSFLLSGVDARDRPTVALATPTELTPLFASEAAPETLTFSWFASHRDLDPVHSSPQKPNSTFTDRSGQAGMVNLWVTVRDDGGGVGWTSAALAVEAMRQ